TFCPSGAASQSIDYKVTSVFGRDGNEVIADANGEFAGFTCEWSCKDSSNTTVPLPAGCKGVFAGLTAGDWTCSGKVKETAGDQCGKTITPDKFTIPPPVGLKADIVGSCAKKFTYSSSPTGGAGGYSCSWKFSGGPTGTPTESTKCSESQPPTIPGEF